MKISKQKLARPVQYCEHKLKETYRYRDKDNNIVGYTGYYGDNNQKVLLFASNDFDWSSGIEASLGKVPLYGQSGVLNRKPNAPVLIVEHERVVIALKRIGICAITSANEAIMVHLDDWSPLNGLNEVYLIPNNDDAGREFMANVATQLLMLDKPPKIKIFQPDDMPEGGSMIDWFEKNYSTTWNDGDFAETTMLPNPKSLLRNVVYERLEEAETIPYCIETDDEWPEPIKFDDKLPPVMPLTEDMLPNALRKWIVNTCLRLQIPYDYVAVSIVIAFGSLIGSGCAIYPKRNDNWAELPNLWGILIGNPGSKKSPALNQAMEIIDRLQAMFDKNYQDNLPEIEVKEIECKSKLKYITNSIQKMAITGGEADEKVIKKYAALSAEAKSKISRRVLKTNETSIQSMTKLQEENPLGMLVLRDEIEGILAHWTKTPVDRTYYLTGWNAKDSYSDIKISRGTTEAKSICISIIGTTQPDKLRTYIKQLQQGSNDGLFQRFQMSVFPNQVEQKVVDIKPDHIEMNRVFNIAEAIAHMNFRDYGAKKTSNSKRPFFRFEEKAQNIFDEWYRHLITVRIPEEQSSLMKEHLSKYPKLMAGLALIFHCIELVDSESSGAVSSKAAKLAIKWCKYLETHARRIYALETPEMAAALKLKYLIETNKLESPFTVKSVYGRHRSGLLKDDVEMACAVLENKKWIAGFYVKPKTGRPTIQYTINPKVFD